MPTITPQHLEHLALFPLPNAVFYPQTTLPLHIFEPRYRALVSEALEDQLPLCIVRMLEPRAYDERNLQRFHEVGCAGFIKHHQLMPDGRYNIIIEGMARVRIIEEIDSDRLYRVGRAQLEPDTVEDRPQLDQLLTTLRGCVVGLQNDFARLSEAIARIMNNTSQPGTTADAIASIIIPEADTRQAFLEERRPEVRLSQVIERLGDLMLRAPNPRGDEDPWLN